MHFAIVERTKWRVDLPWWALNDLAESFDLAKPLDAPPRLNHEVSDCGLIVHLLRDYWQNFCRRRELRL